PGTGVSGGAAFALAQRPVDLAAGVAVGERAALVDALLALGEAQLDLHAAVCEVEGERHERHPPLRDLLPELGDLAPVEQELAVAQRLVVLDVSLPVGGDVRADQENLAVAQLRKGLADVAASVAQRLDLGPLERDARLHPFEDVEVVPRLTVLGDELSSLRHRRNPRWLIPHLRSPAPAPGRAAAGRR